MVDLIIVAALILACFWGVKKGLVCALYSIMSIFISLVLVFILKDTVIDAVAKSPIGDAIGNFVTEKYSGFGAEKCSMAIISVISVVGLYFIIGAVLRMFGGVLKAMSNIPVIKSINKVAGGALGVVVGILWVVVAVNVFFHFPQFAESVESSFIVENFGLLI